MTIQNVTASVNGLTYKSLIQRDIKNLLGKGALVHMFEFKTDDMVARNGVTVRKADQFMNFTNALMGKATGIYSIYRKKVFFDEQLNILQALPCSGIKAGFPMQLFTDQSNVGVLINPAKVNIVVMQTQDAYSDVYGAKKIALNPHNIFDDKTLEKANFGDTEEYEEYCDKVSINVHRTKEEYKELKRLFNGHFWDLYSGGKNPGEKGFIENISSAIKGGLELGQGTPPMMTEILAHVKPEAIVGIVMYSDNVKKRVDYDKCKSEYNGYYELRGIMLANLLREKLKVGKDVSLPILHYHSNLDITSSRDLIFNFTAPSIREVNIESRKIADILKATPHIRIAYEHYLGKDRVQEIVMGKTNIAMGGK